MKILNTTFYIRPSLHADFMQWMADYVGAIPAEIHFELDRITSPAPDADTEAYALRLMADNDMVLDRWHDGDGAVRRSELGAKFGEMALHFTTGMEQVEIQPGRNS